jgi:hypothetical protein
LALNEFEILVVQRTLVVNKGGESAVLDKEDPPIRVAVSYDGAQFERGVIQACRKRHGANGGEIGYDGWAVILGPDRQG